MTGANLLADSFGDLLAAAGKPRALAEPKAEGDEQKRDAGR